MGATRQPDATLSGALVEPIVLKPTPSSSLGCWAASEGPAHFGEVRETAGGDHCLYGSDTGSPDPSVWLRPPHARLRGRL